MEISFTKGRDKDLITAIRTDGTVVKTTFPKKGQFPHDAVHVIVEKRLGLTRGFWGIVANGMAPEDVGALARENGHASSTRADIPHESIHELLTAERIVECFEAELWSKPSDFKTFKAVLAAACASSHIDMPELKNDDIREIRQRLKGSLAKWQSLETGGTMTMHW